MEFELFLMICNYIGTIAFAVSGAVKGIKKKLDIFGISLLSVITAVGGGIIRDTIANRIPTALTDPAAIYLSIGVAIIMYIIVINLKQDKPLDKRRLHLLSQINLIFDAIGLAIFALIGASTGVALQLNAMTSGILAVLTGVGGGIARDLLVNETPIVLKEDVYAVLALFSGILYHLCVVNWHLPQIPTFISIFMIALIIRLLVIKYKVNLPNMESKRKGGTQF
ncbi:trimeric intracellular cation channel family protein [Streptococcus ruminantium]|uniref:Trimeric intracellular cation channel family protein n=1 Tax=Streptococcus ruminantium TaxID=1917441 RepID=A0ABU1B218_9STRE|nr:trimeric intracellular cation channel family protein [Streptococcus ruminantium]MDQ8758598.1 trimeric intracellular cation channel family protein [Streptococcus ruminantium]MDQ8769358.1 trimeric intracellular cation channel family protein [Streptococcus ruminantium]MDQ8774126.1 trimeric intracellular cation channel family protein [Streptococcus ruminantium]MDQ8793156.1 trimeric intracellular cation channel family protein [Streptococcus ruminantium]MDQ8795239.1 trimeric intracellular cation 